MHHGAGKDTSLSRTAYQPLDDLSRPCNTDKLCALVALVYVLAGMSGNALAAYLGGPQWRNLKCMRGKTAAYNLRQP